MKIIAKYPSVLIRVIKGGKVVEGFKPMELLCLGANRGDKIFVKARGPEAREALEAITDLFNKGFLMDEKCLPIPASHSEWIELPDSMEPPPSDAPNG